MIRFAPTDALTIRSDTSLAENKGEILLAVLRAFSFVTATCGKKFLTLMCFLSNGGIVD